MVVNLKEVRDSEVLNIHCDEYLPYKKLDIIDILNHTLIPYYNIPQDGMDGSTCPIDKWNPILLCEFSDLFDPNVISPSTSSIFTESYVWGTHTESTDKRTIVNTFLTKIFEHPNKFFLRKPEPQYHDRQHEWFMAFHFVYTFEMVSKKELVINVINLKDRSYKRLHIKDVYRVCSLLKMGNFKEFERLFGIFGIKETNSKLETFDVVNYLNNLDNLRKEIHTLIGDGSHIPIQDEYVTQILDYLTKGDVKVYYLP